MSIDLMNLRPHKVSRDLSGYITYVYDDRKSGKTTFASHMSSPLILPSERGYNALHGVITRDIITWGEIKQTLHELKKPKVKGRFKSIAVDIVDIAGTLCEKYICSQNDIDAMSGIPYGQGWNMIKKEFEEVFRTITQLGYAVEFTSHSKDKAFKTKTGIEYICRGSLPIDFKSKSSRDTLGGYSRSPRGRRSCWNRSKDCRGAYGYPCYYRQERCTAQSGRDRSAGRGHYVTGETRQKVLIHRQQKWWTITKKETPGGCLFFWSRVRRFCCENVFTLQNAAGKGIICCRAHLTAKEGFSCHRSPSGHWNHR